MKNWCARIDLAIAPFILIMITTVWAIISTVSEIKIVELKSDTNEWGQRPMTENELCTATILKWSKRCE